MKGIIQSTLTNQARHHRQQFKGFEEYNYTVGLRTGWRLYPSTRPTSSSSSAYWEQHDDWKSNQSWDSWRSSTWTELWEFVCREVLQQKLHRRTCCQGDVDTPFLVLVVVFRLPETFNSLANDGRCKQVHLSHAIFERVQLFTVCLHSFAHCTWTHTLHAWLKIALHSRRVVPSLAPCLTPWHTEHAARLPHHFLQFLVLNHREGWSHPQHPAQIHGNHKRVAVILNDLLAQVMSPTGSSTTRSLMNRRPWLALKTMRPLKIEDHVKALSYNQSFLSSTQDSAESTATPQETDFDDEQIRALLASPRYPPEREASAERSPVYHWSLMSSSSQGLKSVGTGRPVALFSRQSRLNQDAFSEREQLVCREISSWWK